MSQLDRIIFDPDVTAPSVPSGLVATPFTTDRIDLSWSPSTDAGSGVAGYEIQKDSTTQIPIGVQTSYSDTGLLANTTHTYRVRARDGAGNLSAYSTLAQATTPQTSQQTAVKYNPGWGVWDQPPYSSLDALRGTSSSLIAELGTIPNCKHYVMSFYWGGLQTGDSTAGASAYKFDVLDQALALCQANNQRLHIVILWSVGSAGTVDFQVSQGRFPAYLRDRLNGIEQSNPVGRCSAAVYRAVIMDEYLKLIQAIANHSVGGVTLNNHPWFEGVHTYDSSQQFDTALGFTFPAYVTELVRMCQVATVHLSATGFFVSVDGGLGGTTNIQTVIQGIETNRCIMTGIDVMPVHFTAFGGSDTGGNPPQKVYQGLSGTKDFRSTLAWGGRMSPNNLGDVGCPTFAQQNPTTVLNPLLINVARNTFNARYLFLPYKTQGFDTQGNGSTNNQFWDTAAAGYTLYHPTIKEFLQLSAATIALNSAQPPNYADITAPSVPAGVAANAVSSSQINVTWNAATDTGGSGLAGYDVLKDGTTTVQVPVQTTYNDTGLIASSTHTYRVRSRDVALNVSAYSTQVQATTQAGAAGFTNDAGFTGSFVTTAAHGNLMNISRSAGSFGTHANNNPNAAFTWNSRQHLMALFNDFEDGVLEKRGCVHDPDWNAGNVNGHWTVDTGVKPVGLTRSARRQRASGAEQGGLQWTPSTNPGFIYSTFKFMPGTNMQAGKFYRHYAGGNDVYFSTGCDNLTIRAAANTGPIYDPGTIVKEFTPNVWSRVEIFVNISGNVISFNIDGTQVTSQSGWIPSFPVSGHTTDLGHMMDSSGAGRCASHPSWDGQQWYADWIIDYQRARFEIANAATWAARTKSEMQVPTTWATGSVQIAINRGEHASLIGKYLYYIDSTETATRLGQFT